MGTCAVYLKTSDGQSEQNHMKNPQKLRRNLTLTKFPLRTIISALKKITAHLQVIL